MSLAFELPSHPSRADAAYVIETIKSHPHDLLVQPNGERAISDWGVFTKVDPEAENRAAEAEQVRHNLDEHDPLVRACHYVGGVAVELRSHLHLPEHHPQPDIQRSPDDISFAGMHRVLLGLTTFR